MAAIDLVTLDAAREFLQRQYGQTEQDDVIAALITEASSAIRWSPYGREFAPAVSSTARDFVWDGCSRRVDLAPYDARSVSSVVVDPDDGSPSTLAASDYRLRPIPAEWGVYYRLELSATLSLPAPSTDWNDRVVRVTGNWGFASVPEDVELACKLYVAGLIRGEVQAFGSALQPNSLGEGVNDDEAFPPGVRGLLRPYMRMTF